MAKGKDRDEQRRDTLRAFVEIFEGERGKLVLEELRNAFDRPAYKPGDSATDAIWRDGQRSVLLHIDALVAQGLTLRRVGSGSNSNSEQ